MQAPENFIVTILHVTMSASKRNSENAGNGCESSGQVDAPPDLVATLETELRADGVRLKKQQLRQFACKIQESLERYRKKRKGCTKVGSDGQDAIHDAIADAVRRKEYDEACWLSFLATHFGDRDDSAINFYNGFSSSPMWTWKKVRRDPQKLHDWLISHPQELRDNIRFGNHRKREAKIPDRLWQVIESFIQHAGDRPSLLFRTDAPTPQDRFNILYKRTSGLYRFGRTGRFDLLCLMRDVGLIDVEADSCYLNGATGPLSGAKRLWGNKRIDELDRLALDLSNRMNVPPEVMEDALCNWQKLLPKQPRI